MRTSPRPSVADPGATPDMIDGDELIGGLEKLAGLSPLCYTGLEHTVRQL